MRSLLSGLIALVVAALLGAACPVLADEMDEAKALFARYIALEHAYDSGLADLYDDEALIEAIVTHADGTADRLTIPAPLYKAKLRQLMSLAEQKEDHSNYSDTQYVVEKRDRKTKVVRITSNRHDLAGGYTVPHILLVGPKQGQWLILEERSEIWP